MAFSVNTNSGALLALQNLNSTNRDLSVTQNRINTGLNVAGAKDNAASFAIAQRLRADVAGLNSVQSSLDNAQSALDVGLAAAEATSDLLIEMRERAVAAVDAGLDADSRSSLNDDFAQLRDQITSIVATAEFNGTNVVDGTGSINAITSDDGSQSITIAGSDLSLAGAVVTVSAAASIDATTAASRQITNIDASIDNVNAVLSSFGAGANRLEVQSDFTSKLSDSIEVGIGNLVDADLAQEAANLQSLQVRQQLGLQALSIANQAPSAVLGLF